MNRTLAAGLLLVLAAAHALRAADAPANPDPDQLRNRVTALEQKVAELEQTLGPLRAELAAKARQAKLQAKVQARLQQDAKAFKPEELKEIERLFQAADANWADLQAADNVELLQRKFPRANLTGCGLLKLAETARGEEREVFLGMLIKDYGDCWFKDGVQAGPYARYLLALDYAAAGQAAKAEKLAAELRGQFADAVNHDGQLLVELLPKAAGK